MRSRILHIFMGLWWAVFTIVVVPGHTRGVIPLATKAACPMCAGETKGGPQKPVEGSAGNCSICYVVATLSTTPVVPIFTVRFTMIARAAAAVAEIPILNDEPLSILCRGPPGC